MIRALLIEHPFEQEKNREIEIKPVPGLSVESALVPLSLTPKTASVYLIDGSPKGGRIVPAEDMAGELLFDGYLIFILPDVAGGGGQGGDKNLLAIVAAIGLSILTSGVYSAVLGATGGMFWAYAAAIYVGAAGSYLLSLWFPPPKAEKFDPSYGWGNLSNMQGERNPIPLVFNSYRYGGQIIAKYIETDGDRQYMNVLLCGNWGPVDYTGHGETDDGDPVDHVLGIDEIQINGQDIANFPNVEIYKRAGLNNQSVIPNFNDVIATQTPGFELTVGDEFVYTTAGNAGNKLEIVLNFPQGLYSIRNKTGKTHTMDMSFLISYKLHADLAYTALPAYNFSEAKKKPFNKTYIIDGLAAGQYDVKVELHSINGWGETRYYQTYWSVLRHIAPDDLQYPNMALLGLRALATDVLSGGEFAVTAIWKRSACLVWNGAAFVSKPLSNPAWAVYDILCQVRAYVNINTAATEYLVEGVPVSLIDYDRFVLWADFCDDNSLVCNYVLSNFESVMDAIQPLEEIGRGRCYVSGSKLTCVWDSDDDTPVQLFTQANMIKGSYSRQIVPVDQRATSIELTFRDADKNYDQRVITVKGPGYDDLSTTPNPIKVDLRACTDRELAYRIGYYRMLTNWYINESCSFGADIDSIECEIGDCVAIQRGRISETKTGRVVDCIANKITLNQEVTLAAGVAYTVRIRLANDEQIDIPIVIAGVNTTTDELTPITPLVADRMAAVRIDATHFSVVGDQTAKLTVGLDAELRFGTSSVIQEVLARSFGGGITTVTVGAVPSGLDSVRYDWTMPEAGDVYVFGVVDEIVTLFKFWGTSRDQDGRRKFNAVIFKPEVYAEIAEIPDDLTDSFITDINLQVIHHVDEGGSIWLDIGWIAPERIYAGARVEVNNISVYLAGSHEVGCSVPLFAAGDYTVKVTTLDFNLKDYATETVVDYPVTDNPPPPEPTAIADGAIGGCVIVE